MRRFSQADLDDIRARNALADVAGGYVRLRRAGTKLVGPCPVCGGKVSSQRFEILADGESWVCAVCPDGGDVIRLVEKVEGCDFLGAVEKLGGRRAVDPDQAQKLFEAREKKRLKREQVSAAYRDAERLRLYKAWCAALPLPGTPAARYLEGRGLLVPDPCPGLGYLPQAPYFHGEEIDLRGRKSQRVIHKGPALVAAFVRGDGSFGGLHTTWLSADDPPRKIEICDPGTGELLPAKKMRGSKTNAHITLTPPKALAAAKRLFVGEGIETVMAVLTAHLIAGRDVSDAAFWAAGDLGNLAGRAAGTIAHPSLKRPDGKPQRVPGAEPDPDDVGLSIPDSVSELILLGDGDSEGVLTQCAMARAARRYARDGRTIRIAFAPAGRDFNDVLRSSEAAE